MLAAEMVASNPGVRDVEPATRSVVDLMRWLLSRVTTTVMKSVPGAARPTVAHCGIVVA
jgi:hypothetical protein